MLRRSLLTSALLAASVPVGRRRVPAGALLPLLPAPTGPHAVGARNLQLTDPGRGELFPNGTSPRRFMITVRYPTSGTGTSMAYASANWWNDFMIGQTIGSGLADSAMAGNISGRRTFSASNAVLSTGGAGQLPVALFSPGFGLPHITQTALAEDLASHGWIVVTIGHVYDSLVEETPQGLKYQYKATLNDWYWQTATTTRVGDIRTVLDQLPGLGYGIGPAATPDNVIMIGHSLGGAASLAAADTDARIAGVMTLDAPAGVVYGGVTHVPDSLPCPVMSLSVENDPDANILSPTWAQMLSGGTNGHAFYDLRAVGAKHLAFTDFAALTGPAKRATYVGSIDSHRAIGVTCDYSLAFANFTAGVSDVDPLSAVFAPEVVIH